jgi:hypothetical protein
MPLSRSRRAVGRANVEQGRKRRELAFKAVERAVRPSKADRLIRMLTEDGLGPFETEWAFAKAIGRGWLFDIAWPHLRVAVEIEGGIFGKGKADGGEPCKLCGESPKGAHGTATGILRDIEKYNAGLMLGWRIYRVPTHAITWETIHTIRQLLALARTERRSYGRIMSKPRPMV